MMTPAYAADALVDALNASTGAAPALSILARPRSPMRELRPQPQPDGSVALTLAKRGFEYKHRGPRPHAPPPADTDAIRTTLTATLAPHFTVTTVTDNETDITLNLKELCQ